jgi:hypothetical protein
MKNLLFLFAVPAYSAIHLFVPTLAHSIQCKGGGCQGRCRKKLKRILFHSRARNSGKDLWFGSCETLLASNLAGVPFSQRVSKNRLTRMAYNGRSGLRP